MALRFVDQPSRVGRLAVTLDPVGSSIIGTNLNPAARTGTIASQLDAVTGNLQGKFTPIAPRSGIIASVLDPVIGIILGTFANANRIGVLGALLGDATATFIGSVTNPSAGAVPDKVANVVAYTSGDPGSAYTDHSFPSGNGFAVDSFRSVCSDGTISNITIPFTSPVAALSCRENQHGLSAGSKTFQVQAHNANGWGPLSDPSNAVTVAAITGNFLGSPAVFMECGNDATIGLSARVGDNYAEATYRYVDPGTPALDGSGFNAPAYPVGVGMSNQKLAEVTGGASTIQLHYFNDNPAGSNNGEIDLNNYNFWCFAFFVESATQRIFIPQLEFTFGIAGVISAVSGSGPFVLTLDNQSFPANAWTSGSAAGNSAAFNRRNGAASAITANTANTVTVSSGAWSVGDHVYFHTADQRLGNAFGPGFGANFEPFITLPTSGVMTVSQWNFAKIPLGATGLNIRNVAGGFLYKNHMGVPTGSGPWWACLNGFCQ